MFGDVGAMREAHVVANEGKGHARGRFKLGAIAGEVGIGVESEGDGVGFAAGVASKDPTRGVVDVAHESVQCSVAPIRPLRYARREELDDFE